MKLTPREELGLSLATRWPTPDDKRRQFRSSLVGCSVGLGWLVVLLLWLPVGLWAGLAIITYFAGYRSGMHYGYQLCYKFKTGGLCAMLRHEMEEIHHIETPEMVESVRHIVERPPSPNV